MLTVKTKRLATKVKGKSRVESLECDVFKKLKILPPNTRTLALCLEL